MSLRMIVPLNKKKVRITNIGLKFYVRMKKDEWWCAYLSVHTVL